MEITEQVILAYFNEIGQFRNEVICKFFGKEKITKKDMKDIQLLDEFSDNAWPDKIYIYYKKRVELGYIFIEGDQIGWVPDPKIKIITKDRYIDLSATIKDLKK